MTVHNDTTTDTTLVQQQLIGFDSISLDEMDRVKLMDRIETKFVFSANKLPLIFDQIRHHYDIVSIDGNVIPAYKTVYYDTDDLFFYHEHHRKRKNRYKVRFRNYVDSQMTFLEVKHKKNGRTDKKRVTVENENFVINEEGLSFLKSANINQDDLHVTLTNTYNRVTLVSKHQVERVTLDFNIQYEHLDTPARLHNVVIMEVKQPRLSRDTIIYKALKQIQIRPLSISKYCIGIMKTYGIDNVKYNRFKKKLLRLDKIIQE